MSLSLDLVLLAEVKSQLCHDRAGATKVLTSHIIYFILHPVFWTVLCLHCPAARAAVAPLSHTGDTQVAASHGTTACELTEVTCALA